MYNEERYGIKMKIRLILLALFALINISPTPFQLWNVQENSIMVESGNYSSWQMNSPNLLASIDFGSDQDCIEYSGTSIIIADCMNKSEGIKWQSPPTWKVTEAISADLNRDGKNELVMVVWRPHKAWPIDTFLPSGGRIADFHDRSGLSCHLILVGWDGENYRELWAGSSLIDPVFGIRAADLDNDGSQELVALEGRYDNKNDTGNLTVWDWSGFGFRLRARQRGDFSEFGIVSNDKNVLVISD